MQLLSDDVYKFHACIAENWRDKNVLIAGDASSNATVYGCRHGCWHRDVANLAWKIHLLFQNKAYTILNTYMHEV